MVSVPRAMTSFVGGFGQGGIMQMVVVMRQLTAVLDELLVRETYKLGLTPEDALMLA